MKLGSNFILALFVLLFGIFSSGLFANSSPPAVHQAGLQKTSHQNILILHSYDPGYEWTKEFQAGISDAFDSSNKTVKLSIEYMDTKRLVNQEYFQVYDNYLDEKYRNYHFDGILVTDDRALQFLNSSMVESLKGVPTVAAGISDLEVSLTDTTDKGTILNERDYIAENLALIAKLRPNLKKLYYLTDESVSSVLIHSVFMNEAKKYTDIEIVEIKGITLADAESLLSKISPDDAVILTHFNTEIDNNIYHGYTKTALTLSSASRAPIFVYWGFYLKGDVLGGYVNRSYSLGIKMVDILGKQLPDPIQISISPEVDSPAVFIHSALKKYGISERALPKDSVIIGKPISFWTRNYEILLSLGAVIVLLICVIGVLSLSLKRKREMIRKDRKIVALQNQTLHVQKNLINVLGDSIETRSGETGNHVKRVATLSSHLAKLAGLSHREREVIEIISPMHDVGKIGIPEAILNKPGKLSPEEWKLMQTHAKLGYNLLHNDEGDIMNLASVVALEHHERWDGKGYPDGKAGEEIHIFARITAIADVFDALRSRRCYKEAWPIESVIEYFKENRGTQFDPNLIDLFLDHIEEFKAIRVKYPD
ncbi:HD domain-containing phosphohydrolase [Vibrio sp. HN007]|uniref:HD domain-containing phosphohydrolase n=1 Tax=Vibrio iocasae TaxID=3098914 RepID=UPI0035D5042A